MATSVLISCETLKPKPEYCLLRTSDFSVTCRDLKTDKIYDASMWKLKDEDVWIATNGEDFAELKKYWMEREEKLKSCQGYE